MPKLVVHYRMVAKPGRGADVIATYEGMMPIFEREPGTEQYLLTQSLDDPDVLWAHELFSSREAFDEHRESALADRFVPALRDLLVSTEALMGTPVKAAGVAIA
jgi:quinol monooxygenase YgiN